MGNKKLILLIFFFALFILAGCWDAVELEDRGFLSGIAVDLAEKQGGNPTFEMTNQFVVPAGLGTPTAAGGGEAFRNLSQTGESLYEINSAISRQANRDVNIEHLELVIFSASVAKEEGLFPDVMDVFIRQQNMRRGILLAVTDGKAGDLLNVSTEHSKIPARYISELTENRQGPESTERVRIGDIQEKMINNRSFIIPQLAMFSNNSINYEGLAVFQGHTSQMVGTLKGGEAKGLNFIRGEDQQGSVTEEVEGEQTTFAVLSGGSKIKLKNSNKESLKFQVDIDVSARISEYFGSLDPNRKKNMEKFEGSLNRKIKSLAEDAIKKVKDDFRVDVFQFDNYLRINHYELWENIKKDWDYGENYFAKSDITVNVNTTIIEPGNSYRIKQQEEDE